MFCVPELSSLGRQFADATIANNSSNTPFRIFVTFSSDF
jgi:hypothetical protein